MPITRLDVCDLIHTRSEESLEISSSCSIVLAHNVATSSILDEIAAASKLPTFENVWVQRSGRLRLSLTLVLDAVSSDNKQKEIFIRQLGEKFTNAELWRQLGLQCSLFLPIETGTCPNDSKRIEFMLFHTEATYRATKGFKNNIIANTRSHDGVPTADLQEISIIWALSSLTNSASDRDCKRLNGGILMTNTGKFLSSSEEDDSEGYISLAQPNPRLPSWDAEHQHDWPVSMTVASGTDAQMLDEAADEHQEISIMSLLSTQAYATQVLQHRQPLDKDRKRPRSISSPLFDLRSAQKMIDIAFHEIISGRNIPDFPKVSEGEVVARPKLSEISPALFSPGYLQALSRQSQCICTIAYSMVSVNDRTTSKPLKDAFALLWNTKSSTTSYISEPPSPEAQTPVEGLASIIKVRAWMIMQRLLFEPAAVATLKPLSCGVSQGVTDPLKNSNEYSSPVALIDTVQYVSSPATEILDDFYLLDEDFDPLFEESDGELILDEYDMAPSIWENISNQKSDTSSYGFPARPPMSLQYHQSFDVADEHNTEARNNRVQSDVIDNLRDFGSNAGEPIDIDSPFEALDTSDVPSIGCAERVDFPSDLDTEEMLLDNPRDDGLTISNGDDFRDTMEMLDHISVDEGIASDDNVDSEPDEMLDALDLDDETVYKLVGTPQGG